MTNIKPIKNEQDYEQALLAIDMLMDAKPNTKEADELEVLAILIENYEMQYYNIDIPDPIEAIKFRMEQDRLTQKDLAQAIGDETRVSKILNRQRALTVKMIKNLHYQFKIPLQSLIGKVSI